MPPRSVVGKLLQKLRGRPSVPTPAPTTAPITPAYVPPTDKVQAATALTRLRDLGVEASTHHLTLAGQLDARRAAIIQAIKDNDYPRAGNLLDTLTEALRREKQAPHDKLAFEKAAGDLLKPKGAVATAKALPTPSNALKTLRADLLVKDKAVNDLLVPSALDHAEATLRLPALAAAAKALIDAKTAWDALKKDWDSRAAHHGEATSKLAQAAALGSPLAATLKARLQAVDKAVAEGDLQKAIDALPALRTDILAALTSATERKACETEYAKIANVYLEAGKVPQLNDALKDLHTKLEQAWDDFYNDFAAFKYVDAQPKLTKVNTAAQAVIKAAMNAARDTQPVINAEQQARADDQLKSLGEQDRKKVQALLDTAPSPKHKQNLQKALACGHTPSELAAFNARIQDKDEQWLQDHLHLAGSSSGTGVQQQWVMSCQATTAQATRAELDPVYALSLHDSTPDLHTLVTDDSVKVAIEQKAMLESAQDQDIDAKHQSDVTKRLAGEDPVAAAALQKLIDDAPSNWEKNQVMEVIARPQNHDAASIKAYYDQHVKGKGGGEAIHKTVSSAPAHRGRFGGDLLNRNKDSTGLTYDRRTADDITRDAAVDDVAESLAKGHAVPLIVGQADGETAHYVLALTVHPGPPKTFFIHDPASGTTVTRTEAQMKNNQLDLPSGWSRLTQYEKPSKA